MSSLQIELLDGEWAVSRLGPADPVPEWADSARLASITRTRDELSILCPAEQVPQGVRTQKGFAALAVRGPLDFGLTGILADLSAALAGAGVPIFVVSTYDTDLVLVPVTRLDEATSALTALGHTIG